MELFLQGLGLGFSAAAQPGPFQAYLLAQSSRNGPVRTMPIALVPLVSDPAVIAVVLAVLAQVPAGFVRALQVAGGLLLLWLAAGALRAARTGGAAATAGREAPRGFWRAVLVNFTNPNAWMFWSLVGGPVVAQAWRTSPPRAAAFFAGFYLLLTGGNVALVALAGGIGRLGPSFSRALGALSGVALLGLGVWQIGRGIAGA
ncbi:MAG TPA: LysE family transporter [Anaeromyxobacteraceae bacterium]|nr:LysE family transporter [Anaeromyxobacteraceae bacterium]